MLEIALSLEVDCHFGVFLTCGLFVCVCYGIPNPSTQLLISLRIRRATARCQVGDHQNINNILKAKRPTTTKKRRS